MTIADELARLEELRRNGSITEQEFLDAKRRVFSEQPTGTAETGSPHAAGPSPPGGGSPLGVSSAPGQIQGVDEKLWCILMHLSQLLVFSGLGIIVPIVMWVVSKDESEWARQNGARMMNWLISSLIYAAISSVLVLVFIGIPMLFVIGILDLIFPIIAALKANDGVAWRYPLAIRFIDED